MDAPLRVSEVAKELGVTLQRVKRYLNRGVLPFVEVVGAGGGRRRHLFDSIRMVIPEALAEFKAKYGSRETLRSTRIFLPNNPPGRKPGPTKPAKPPSEYVSQSEVARALGTSQMAVNRLVLAGTIPSVVMPSIRHGQEHKIRKSDFEAFIAGGCKRSAKGRPRKEVRQP